MLGRSSETSAGGARELQEDRGQLLFEPGGVHPKEDREDNCRAVVADRGDGPGEQHRGRAEAAAEQDGQPQVLPVVGGDHREAGRGEDRREGAGRHLQHRQVQRNAPRQPLHLKKLRAPLLQLPLQHLLLRQQGKPRKHAQNRRLNQKQKRHRHPLPLTLTLQRRTQRQNRQKNLTRVRKLTVPVQEERRRLKVQLFQEVQQTGTQSKKVNHRHEHLQQQQSQKIPPLLPARRKPTALPRPRRRNLIPSDPSPSEQQTSRFPQINFRFKRRPLPSRGSRP